MTEPSISVERLSKRYRLVTSQGLKYRTLRDTIAGVFHRRVSEPPANTIWALKDVSFDVARGEAVGLIGHNGAGKSTLLKILSRITEPTEGRAVLRGRVTSLLEVGTGFHPELNGRENIFLNGAILGMSRAEIRQNFDAIVAFAEVERFLDTPVKRYSSGMFVRLAFAVAAHLTPEILLVDEVLAVGDVEFQRRCLGRMNEVARSGRTVIFVSHNLASIERLCTRAVLMRHGQVARFGSTRDVVGYYLSSRQGESAWDLTGIEDREGTGRARVSRLELLSVDGLSSLDVLPMSSPFRVRVHYTTTEPMGDGATVGLCILTENDERLGMTSAQETRADIGVLDGPGFVDCIFHELPLLPGTYYLEVWISDPKLVPIGFADHIRMVGKLQVVVSEDASQSVADLLAAERGRIFLDCRWERGRG